MKFQKINDFQNSKDAYIKKGTYSVLRKTPLFMGIAASLSITAAGSVWAQDADATSVSTGVLETVVVTSQRREQDLQDVPIAVTAFSDNAIARGDLNSIGKLEGQVPGLVVSTDVTRTNIAVRGIGSGLNSAAAEAGVPVNIDGVYMTRTTLHGAVFGDLKQIEVLRGPQGTLYGRNATGGTINVWTQTPDGELSGDFSTLQGNNGHSRLRGIVSFPITDNLSARVGVENEVLDGHIYNITLGEMADPEDHTSGRLVVSWLPTDELDVTFRANVSQDKVGSLFTQYLETRGLPTNPLTPLAANPPFLPVDYLGGETSEDELHIRNNFRSRISFDDRVFSLTASYDMDWATLKSVTAYQEHSMEGAADTDGTSGDFTIQVIDEYSEAWTQEFTLAGGSDNLDWVVGFWAMEDKLDSLLNVNTIVFIPRPPFNGNARADLFFNFKQKTESMALFGQATYSVTDRLRVTAGLRYTDEEKTVEQNIIFGPPESGVDLFDYTELSPKVSIDFDLTDDIMAYASVSEGFKAGGVNVSQIGNSYDAEILLSYEAGLKSEWMEGRFQANLNAYYYDFQGFQGTSLVGVASLTSNAADAEVIGLEAELSYKPTDFLTLKADIAYSDSEFGDFISPLSFGPPGFENLKGNELPFQAEYTGNLSALYEVTVGDGLLTLSANYSFTTEYFLQISNADWSKQDGYGKTNIRASYLFEDGSLEGLEVSLFANNLEDELVKNVNRGGNTTGGVVGGFSDPRTYGGELRYRF